MKKIFFLLMAVILCTASAMADRTISGTVVAAVDDEPLIGATVLPLPLGCANGTATDANGNFTLTVPPTCHEIRVSFVGLISREVKISNEKMLIRLSSQENRLDEVMVVAYGTAKRSEYTGSASVVKADELQDALVTSVTSALSGRVAGVQTQSSDGRPGGAPKIRIRGVGSINASAEPLYVVDGVPYDGAISELANSDIESMTVLKDAASTALYGARGANGVVLITTKRGAAGTARVTFDARWGQNQRAIPNYNVLKSTNQYYELMYESLYNDAMDNAGTTPYQAWKSAAQSVLTATGYRIYSLPQGEYLIGRNGKINPNATLGWSDGQYFYKPDNWTDNTMINGLRQEYNLSVAGGTDKLKYYVSGSYLGDDGIIVGSNFNRFSTRASVDYQAKTWLKIGTNMAYTYTNSNYPDDNNTDADSSSGNAFYIANEIAPVYPMFVRDADGKIMYNSTYNRPIYDYGDGKSAGQKRNWMNIANPIGSLLYDKMEYLTDIFDGKWYAIVTPCEGLNITGNAGYWLSNDRLHYLSNPFYGQGADSGGSAEQAFTRTRSINFQALASYAHTFGDKHNMDLMVGYETYNLERENAYAIGYNLYDPTDWTVSNTIDRKLGSGERDIQYTTRGILARAKYNFDNRYFFHASYRRDSSSRFAPDKRWGDFFSVSGAWDIARERFMESATGVDQLKLKVSFGQNGNDNLGSAVAYYYAWQDQYQHTGADGIWNDATLYFKGNRDITWETSNALNAGVDFSFLNGRIDGTLEYYQRQVSNMLFHFPASPSLGYDSYPANAGSMRNYGVELELNVNIFNTPNYSWSINGNITTMGNKVISLPKDLAPEGQWINGSRIFEEGKSMYNMYLVSYAGVNPANGKALYWAKTKADGKEVKIEDATIARLGGVDKVTNIEYVENRKQTGNIMPKAYGGFGTSVYLWGVDINVTFAYQFGGRIFDSTYQRMMHSADKRNLGQNWHVDMLNRWTPENRNTDVPRLSGTDSYGDATSDRFLISSNYLSLNNITVGYTLPSKYTRQIGIESIRVYGAAENVALWSKRRGLDPRQSYTTSINATYSPIRCVSGGIRVEF